MPRFVFTSVFAFGALVFTFALAASPPRFINTHTIPAPIPKRTSVPNIVRKTINIVLVPLRSCGAATTLVRGASGCVIGTTIRGAGSSFGSKSISSIGCPATGGFILRTIVTSDGSSSTGTSRLSLGISMNFGSASSTRGVPSFMQNRRMSSS